MFLHINLWGLQINDFQKINSMEWAAVLCLVDGARGQSRMATWVGDDRRIWKMDRDLDCLLEQSCADGLQRQKNTLGATPVSKI